MTTQVQGKGKKKGKEVKMSIDEFNANSVPLGHTVVNVKMSGGTGIDWADTMAQEKMAEEDLQTIIVPSAPRAQRGPGIDEDSLPNEPPFRVSLFNLPVSVEDKDILERFFMGLNVMRIESSSKSSTTVELATRHDLYEALCKDGTSLKGRTVNVCLYGQQPPSTYGSDRYGSRGGNYNDRYGDRQGGGFGQRSNDRSGDRYGGFNRDRDNYNSAGGAGGGFGRGAGGGFGQPRGGYNDRYNDRSNFRDNNRGQYTSGGGEPESEEPTNWRARTAVKPAPPAPPQQSAYNNGSRQPYSYSRPEPNQHNYEHTSPHQQYQHPDPYYQPRGYHNHNQPSNNSPYNSQFNNQANSDNRSLPPSTVDERPKLKLKPRTTPINPDDGSSVARNEAIFGKAKPTSTPYQKMHEVEEKLKAVQIVDRKEDKPSSQTGSQAGSQPGSAPRSRRVSSNHSESNS